MTDQEHPGGRTGWELKAKRYGCFAKQLHVPIPPDAPRQLVDLFADAVTPQTRVIAVPHITSALAIVFPVEEICRMARERGIFTVVDGAQVCGHLKIDVRRIGCDAYFSSPHKWLLAPKGCGFLYLRKERLDGVWCTLASSNWDNYKEGAFRLMQWGTGNLSLLKGLEAALDFHEALGPARVYARIRDLADHLRAGLRNIPKVAILSPAHTDLCCATTTYKVAGLTGVQVQDALWERSRVRVRSVGEGVRHCCHVYNTMDEVDRSLGTLNAIAGA
jgi:selenocysteine lyase/cysteine desulfurase